MQTDVIANKKQLCKLESYRDILETDPRGQNKEVVIGWRTVG